jgi:hypothetical protein
MPMPMPLPANDGLGLDTLDFLTLLQLQGLLPQQEQALEASYFTLCFQ